ncbi:MAG: LysE family transporter [Desulfomonile tiedjei]|uniref:LysE family transporter n=1 Tax=Desulfomonile tiedjei TaxID=2358 RepID=A0A9D6UYW6_9BACT|nr:LysE family transporter [Desulfomonile tiedjei]
MLNSFIKGLAIGFSLAVPVGPIALLCIRRTLTKGRASGLVSGLGAAVADGVFGAVAGYGVAFIANFLFNHSLALRLVGGIFLCYAGVRIFFSVPPENSDDTAENGLLRDFASTLVLTLTNPLTAVTFAAVFATAGVGYRAGDYFLTSIMVAGVVCGSALWWLILSGIVSIFHGRINPRGLQMVNRISGTLIAAFGLVVLVSFAALDKFPSSLW